MTVDSVIHNLCAGGSTGAIDISVSGGSFPYSFAWSTGDTTEDISGLTAGLFDVTAVDALGCPARGSATVNDGVVITAIVDSSGDVSCHGLSNGFITISVTGGNPSYRFAWTSADTTEDISGLAGGNYSVIITDANGCTASFGPVTILEPAILTLTLDSVQAVRCFGGNNGAAYTTSSGGTAPTSIAWDNNETTEDINNLTAGTYVATLLDANGCTATISATITQPAAALSATSVVTHQVQGGALGSIAVTISGGTAPYLSQWSNGATTEDLNNLSAGIYSSTITDANGCVQIITDTVKLITGIGNIETALAVNLYPNPSQDIVFLDLIFNQQNNVSVEVFNVNGQLINQYARKNIQAAKLEMNFAGEAAGVYYAKIKIGETMLTRKITITR
jgi:large repetitive protein